MNLSILPPTGIANRAISVHPEAPAPLLSIGIVLFNNPVDELTDLALTLRRAMARLVESDAKAASYHSGAVSVRLQNNGALPIDPAIFGSHARLGTSPDNLGFG